MKENRQKSITPLVLSVLAITIWVIFSIQTITCVAGCVDVVVSGQGVQVHGEQALVYPNGDEPEGTREAGALKTFTIAGVDVNFHWAPAGSFLMGSPEDEFGRLTGETQHEVHLRKGFWIAETETTQELWQAVLGDNPSDFGGDNQLPVEQVTWDDCQKFLKKLNRRYRSVLPSGYKYALPTEAQWEYACRSGTTTPFNVGTTLAADQANYNGRLSFEGNFRGERTVTTKPVKSYVPNAWGLYDMHGNVWEWTSDLFDVDFDGDRSSSRSALERLRGFGRVVRGGSWYCSATGCRSAERDGEDAKGKFNDVGLRLVLVRDSEWQDDPSAVSKYPNGDEPESTREAGAIKSLDIAGVGLNFHWAPAGTFLMGSPENEPERNDDESQHEVTLTRGFWIAETETTQELWQAVMGANPSTFKGSTERPVEGLTWVDCQKFVDKLNSDYASALPSGFKYAMPTEAQWEYACRAGTTTRFSFGIALNGKFACFAEGIRDTYAKSTEVVGIFEPNAWGLYDMHGNVSEWCADRYGADYYTTSSGSKDPLGPSRGSEHVVRGGCCSSFEKDCRSASRLPDDGRPEPKYHHERGYKGFRLVLVQESQSYDVEVEDAPAPQEKPHTAREYPNGDEPESTREAGALKTLRIAELDVNFHWVPAGSFIMGCTDQDGYHDMDESQHVVELTNGFWVAETETTQELWQSVMGENPSRNKDGNQLPVDSISWYDCLDFIARLNISYSGCLPIGYKFAMPTEAQWEYACRAGVKEPLDFGETLNYPSNAELMQSFSDPTSPVKSYEPNAWGLYGMHSNVWEWCADWLDSDYFLRSSTAKKNPTGAVCGSDHVLRGGSRFGGTNPTYRFSIDTNSHFHIVGLRLILVPEFQVQASDSADASSAQGEPTAQYEYPNADEPEVSRAAGALKTLTISGVDVNFHWAPAGTFLMGSPEDEEDRFWNDREKQHEVTLSTGFWIAETETTQELWQAVMGNNPSVFQDSNQHPVENVSWNDCQEFVSKLNSDYANALPDGYQFATPTESQWEYACRAGTSTPFSFGLKLNGNNVNCDLNNTYGISVGGKTVGRTTPVKSYAPNKWGLYDMHGNVCEWTSDWFDKDYFASASEWIDPVGALSGSARVLRGGCWKFSPRGCRSAYRFCKAPDRRLNCYGFRLILVQGSLSPESDTEYAM